MCSSSAALREREREKRVNERKKRDKCTRDKRGGLVADLNILGMGSHSEYHMTKKATENLRYTHKSLNCLLLSPDELRERKMESLTQ